jgi:hypothetical protein
MIKNNKNITDTISYIAKEIELSVNTFLQGLSEIEQRTNLMFRFKVNKNMFVYSVYFDKKYMLNLQLFKFDVLANIVRHSLKDMKLQYYFDMEITMIDTDIKINFIFNF